MKLEIIKTPLAEKMSDESNGFSQADTEKAERLLRSARSNITSSLIHLLLKNSGETSEVKPKWDKSDDSTHLIIFHSFHIENEQASLYETIKHNVENLIDNFPYYLYSCEKLAFSKSITPLITNHDILKTLDPTISAFVEKYLYESIASKGRITLTGFFEEYDIGLSNLKVSFKESNDVGTDPNHVYTATGVVIDFNYDDRQFTLLEHTGEEKGGDEKGTKIRFRFSEDEILSAGQEAYFHRYCIEPYPVITVHYLRLSSGNYVRLDLMEEMRVGFNTPDAPQDSPNIGRSESHDFT